MAGARLVSRTLSHTRHKIPAHGPGAGRGLALGLALCARRTGRRTAGVRNPSGRDPRRAVLRRAGPAVSGAASRSPDHAGGYRRDFDHKPWLAPALKRLSRTGDRLSIEPSPQGPPLRPIAAHL